MDHDWARTVERIVLFATGPGLLKLGEWLWRKYVSKRQLDSAAVRDDERSYRDRYEEMSNIQQAMIRRQEHKIAKLMDKLDILEQRDANARAELLRKEGDA